MKKIFLLSAGIALLTLSACKKDNNNNPPEINGQFLPKTYTEDVRSSVLGSSVTVYDLSYDASGRILSLASTPAPAEIKFVYKYGSANTITLDLIEDNQESVHEQFMLNSFSFIDSTFQYDNTSDTTTEKYIYDSNHLLTQLISYNYSAYGTQPSSTTNYTYDDSGNVITANDDQGNQTTYDYYLDMVNNLSLGKSFLPVPHNFVKTVTSTSYGTTEMTTHYYTFDGSKRLVKDSTYVTGADVTVIKSYSY